jgi:prepilin-type N-terminal cleavage/methylation domain-containing protein
VAAARFSRRARGFTLTEMAVVLAIVGLLLGGMLFTLSARIDQANSDTTQRRLDEARELVLGFAIANARLPCPAAAPPYPPYNGAGNDSESPAGGACTDAYAGFLPAKAIGFQPVDASGYALDAWGNPIRYAVSANSSAAGSPDNNFTTGGSMKTNGLTVTPSDLLVCAAWASDISTSTSSPSCGSAAWVTNANLLVAVIWSQGKNFATASSGGVGGQAGNDEALNNKIRTPTPSNNHGVFVSHPPAPASAAGGEFDDSMVWIPVGLLYSRLISAGLLP